jgi:hypothetical protein
MLCSITFSFQRRHLLTAGHDSAFFPMAEGGKHYIAGSIPRFFIEWQKIVERKILGEAGKIGSD